MNSIGSFVKTTGRSFLQAVGVLLVFAVLGIPGFFMRLGINPEGFSTATMIIAPIYFLAYTFFWAWFMRRMGQKRIVGALVGYIVAHSLIFLSLLSLTLKIDPFPRFLLYPMVVGWYTSTPYYGLFAACSQISDALSKVMSYSPFVLMVLVPMITIFVYLRAKNVVELKQP